METLDLLYTEQSLSSFLHGKCSASDACFQYSPRPRCVHACWCALRSFIMTWDYSSVPCSIEEEGGEVVVVVLVPE